MHDQEHGTWPDGSNRYPAFLSVTRDVALCHRVGIVENQPRGFEANVVLAEVLPVLVFVPFKSHGPTTFTGYSHPSKMSISLYVQMTFTRSCRPLLGRVREVAWQTFIEPELTQPDQWLPGRFISAIGEETPVR